MSAERDQENEINVVYTGKEVKGVKVIPEGKPEIKGTTIAGRQTKGVKVMDKSGKNDGQ